MSALAVDELHTSTFRRRPIDAAARLLYIKWLHQTSYSIERLGWNFVDLPLRLRV